MRAPPANDVYVKTRCDGGSMASAKSWACRPEEACKARGVRCSGRHRSVQVDAWRQLHDSTSVQECMTLQYHNIIIIQAIIILIEYIIDI